MEKNINEMHTPLIERKERLMNVLKEQQSREVPRQGHARSQACASGLAKLSRRNHVVQNLRIYFILMLSQSNG